MHWLNLRVAQSLLVSVALAGCTAATTALPPTPTATPGPESQVLNGEQLFKQNCAVCHGEQAQGTKQGPPLVDKIYEPSHHADAAFMLAVRVGSKQHHWTFGVMPAQPQVNDSQVRAITAHVRALQRAAGIR